MSNTFPDILMNYLTSRRTCSLGNLGAHFNCLIEDIVPVIQELEAACQLRLSNSQCASGCSSCSDCGAPKTAQTLTEQTIVISMERRESNE